MDEHVINQDAKEEQAATVLPLTQPTPRQPKAPKRSFEELENVRPDKMTDAEKNECIRELRERLTQVSNEAAAYQGNAQAAFEQYRKISQAFSDYRVKATAKLNFARQSVQHALTSIILAGTLEDDTNDNKL